MLCASPPTMMESVASAAFLTPPDTGASSIATPRSASRAPSSRVPSGDDELMSTRTLPRESPASRQSAAPPAPSRTVRTASPSGSIVITASQRSAVALSDPGASRPGDRIDLQARSHRNEQVGLGCGLHRAVNDLEHERLSERDGIAFQDSAAAAARRIGFPRANAV